MVRGNNVAARTGRRHANTHFPAHNRFGFGEMREEEWHSRTILIIDILEALYIVNVISAGFLLILSVVTRVAHIHYSNGHSELHSNVR